jgi:hypothetical protein
MMMMMMMMMTDEEEEDPARTTLILSCSELEIRVSDRLVPGPHALLV